MSTVEVERRDCSGATLAQSPRGDEKPLRSCHPSYAYRVNIINYIVSLTVACPSAASNEGLRAQGEFDWETEEARAAIGAAICPETHLSLALGSFRAKSSPGRFRLAETGGR